MLTLTSSDGETFEVPRAVAFQSGTIRRICSGIEDAGTIPLINISSIILPELIQYLETSIADEWNAFKNFKAQLVNADLEKLKAFVRAATFLELPNLANAAAEAIKPMVNTDYEKSITQAFNF
uniref:SKP1-like protein 11 n=1 Tax=Nicotiana tabacum TaxID=4097 RepID=A0A1S4CDP4_TOBAC|nr:PREDICTED: SKP1-like protein 11 [Nicotiana tabacum]